MMHQCEMNGGKRFLGYCDRRAADGCEFAYYQSLDAPCIDIDIDILVDCN